MHDNIIVLSLFCLSLQEWIFIDCNLPSSKKEEIGKQKRRKVQNLPVYDLSDYEFIIQKKKV